MAEKRRGLGRGLGSLIPSQETGRPSDVFFPRGERAEDVAQEQASAEAAPARSSDPAESMRRAQASRRTSTTKSSTQKAGATKSGTAKSGTTKARATKSGAAKAKTTTSPATAASKKLDTVEAERTDAKTKSSSAAISNDSVIPDAAASSEAPVSSVVDNTVDDSRDGIYVSRETVRTHQPDPAADTDGSEPNGTNSARAVDEEPASGDPHPSVVEGAAPPEVNTDDGADASAVVEDDLVPVPGTTFGEIDLDLIRPNPRQPRDVFDEDALEELITSIREIGVLQPVVVRRRPDRPGHYELIMGERRYRASKEAGRTTIPAIVRATADDDLLRDALLENLHRVDLNPLEEAAAYAQLLEDFNCTQEELSERIGRSRPQISNTMRLLKLPPMVQRRVAAGVLSSGHARALLGLNDGADMEQLAQRVVAEGLSVRATEEAVVLLNRGDRITVSRGTRQADPELAELARNLGDKLETRVNVVMGKRKGKLSVEFANGEDLARILSLLGLDSPHQ